MQETEFDASIGGSEHLPPSINSLKFASSRSIEIAAMTESILRPSRTKLIFQTLPVHMRRRVMSHNSKRLPRKQRLGHMEQLKKSGLPPKQKRPSRKYRRRPGNLLMEYNRRQRRNVWLETHIWHAKRFHMIERWGLRLAYAPCDKAFRACYRASSAHCLLQDISYYTPIQIIGPLEIIREMFSHMTDTSCGLGITAKAYLSGSREGAVHLYMPDRYPNEYIGKVTFIWVPSNVNANLWLFVHPSQKNQLENVLLKLHEGTQQTEIHADKKRKLNDYEKLQINVLPGTFNRFRLTGPKSHAVLTKALKCIDDMDKIKNNIWIVQNQKNRNNLYLKEKHDYWNKLSLASSPAQLLPNLVLGLVVRDPRLQRPMHRTKAVHSSEEHINLETLINIPSYAANSPLWDLDLHDVIKKHKLSNCQFIEHITKTQLVPGEVNEDDPKLQSVPIILIQRPGSQDVQFKKLGYASGWDIIMPPGYGMFFWQTFIMFGGRSGGLRETENLSFEMGDTYLSIDSNAGKEEESRILTELRDRYFRLPPSKRINYIKMGIPSPFICPWDILLKDWSDESYKDFFVLRNRKLLMQIQECHSENKVPPQLMNAHKCFVPVYVKIIGKGSLGSNALICLPKENDYNNIRTLCEPQHEDPNEKLRKQKRLEHIKTIKSLRRKRVKLKKQNKTVTITKKPKKLKKEPSDYVKMMRELWLPSSIKYIRHSCSREIMGFIPRGAFTFTEARSCGVGYMAYNALSTLLESGQNRVLVRNKSSRKYRLSDIQIIIP